MIKLITSVWQAHYSSNAGLTMPERNMRNKYNSKLSTDVFIDLEAVFN